jgi:dolichyl-phosphate beta-glucosyltransferase
VKLSIVIPAFNEEGKIQQDIRNAHDFLVAELGGNGEIIAVDDGSSDETTSRARAMAAGVPELRVIRYAPNRGKGHALRKGIARSLGQYVMFADAGSCVPYEDALRGLELCYQGADLAHGSRRRSGSRLHGSQPTYRRLGSALFRTLTRTFMGIPRHISDTQCGFKIYRGEQARRLYGETITDGFMFDIEVIRRATREGMRIAEFPVHWTSDWDTRYRPIRGSFANLGELVRIRFASSRRRMVQRP